MTCHSIQNLQSTLGNGGFVMGVPAVMVDENGNRIPGKCLMPRSWRIRSGTRRR